MLVSFHPLFYFTFYSFFLKPRQDIFHFHFLSALTIPTRLQAIRYRSLLLNYKSIIHSHPHSRLSRVTKCTVKDMQLFPARPSHRPAGSKIQSEASCRHVTRDVLLCICPPRRLVATARVTDAARACARACACASATTNSANSHDKHIRLDQNGWPNELSVHLPFW